MNVLGLIPARGGSKGIPRKNLVPLRGRPVLAYTCDAALASTRLSRTILSTDSEEIAAVGRACGVDAPFLRPSEISQDDTPSKAVALHALQWMETQASSKVDAVVLLQPTSPLRTAQHIDDVIDLLSRDGVDTVVSVVEVPHRFNPYSVMTVRDGRLEHYIPDPLPFDRYRRQALPLFWARNGPAVIASRARVLRERGGLYGEVVLPYPMSRLDSLDIDDQFDLLSAAVALDYRAHASKSEAMGRNS
jgi:CMP-N,N'-diacetyllegionaminic acid synthase